MTDRAADERAERIIRSLKENSADFVRKRRAQQNARVHRILHMGLIFVIGVAIGALIVSAL
jgi:hypothetical protein